MRAIFKSSALRLSVVYLILGSLWIIVSDFIDGKFTGQINWFQLLKGNLYVLVTAIIFYFTIRKYAQKSDFNTLVIHSLADNYEYSIALVSPDMKVKFFNNKALEIIGKKKSEVLNKDIYSVIPSYFEKAFKPKFEEVLKTRKKIEFDYLFEHDNKNEYTNIKLIPVFQGQKISSIICISYNYTEEALAKIKNHELFNQYKNIYDTAQKSILLVNQDYIVKEHNPLAEQIFKVEWLNKESPSIEEIDNAELKTYLKKNIFDTINSGSRRSSDFTLNGIFYHFDFCPIKESTLKPEKNVQVIISDMAEKIKLENEIESLKNQISVTQKGLSTISSFVSFAQSVYTLNKDGSAPLTKKENEILDRLVKLNKAINSHKILEKVTIDITSLLLKMKLNAERDIDIKINAENFTIFGDETLLSSLLDKIIQIVKLLPLSEGELTKKMVIDCFKNGSTVELEVNDNTIGIELDNVSQLNDSDKINIKGILSHMHIICDQLNAQLEIETTQNKGNSWVLKFFNQA
jgi:PAS domain-containing protein